MFFSVYKITSELSHTFKLWWIWLYKPTSFSQPAWQDYETLALYPQADLLLDRLKDAVADTEPKYGPQ